MLAPEREAVHEAAGLLGVLGGAATAWALAARAQQPEQVRRIGLLIQSCLILGQMMSAYAKPVADRAAA